MASTSGWSGTSAAALSQLGSKFSNFMARNVNAVGLSAVATAVGFGLVSKASRPSAISECTSGCLLARLAELLARDNGAHRQLFFASLSLGSVEEVVEPKTGFAFPSASADGQQLAGIGLRKKSIFGLKSITVYAYGVYVDPESLKVTVPIKAAEQIPGLLDDVVEKDVALTVRLVIVYGKLKIGAIRSAFEGSIGSGLKKFSGEDNRDLLESFTSAFKDDLKIPRGTTIELTRLPGQVLQTKVGGEEVGRVQSPLLCRALFDLYLGDDAFDKSARENIGSSLSHLLAD